MQTKYCEACGQQFQPRSQTPHQTYCSNRDCQRVRRLKWQRDKRNTDLDYAENQARAQQAWSKRNADYWKKYRAEHPDYVEQNRQMQRVRRAHAAGDEDRAVAKMYNRKNVKYCIFTQLLWSILRYHFNTYCFILMCSKTHKLVKISADVCIQRQ